MPSRLIHYVIAERLKKEITFEHENRFFIGSICPDLSKHEDGSKRLTHFQRVSDWQKGPNWNEFCEKYGDRMREDELYQGIFCHIITDALWFHDVFDPLVRIKSETVEEERKSCNIGYDDFHKLNYILSQDLNLRYHITKDEDIIYEGLHLEWFDFFLNEMRKDIENEPMAIKSDLQIYDYDMVCEFIDHCVELCKSELWAFYDGRTLTDASQYYVKIRYGFSR